MAQPLSPKPPAEELARPAESADQAGDGQPLAPVTPVSEPTTPPPEGGASPAQPVRNVWSRSQRKHRVRAALLLLLNLFLFCGLCIFTHWLHVARAFDFTWSSYSEPMKFWGEQTQNLNDFVVYPVSVEQNFMHGVVLGLLVASIVAVPISVAILYGFPYALPFIAGVFVFAHMPWMALTLSGACILAAVKPFRLSFRFGAALVGMLPVALYLYLATQGTPQQIGSYSSPDQKLLLAMPWVLAILAACFMLATILAISRIVNYRPGAVAPVMAIMFATPAILFQRYIGFDEVSYRVLETAYGPRSQAFAGRDVTADIFSMLGEGVESPAREQVLGWVLEDASTRPPLPQPLARRLLRSFMADRRAAYEACRSFIADHPKSRYVPCALYMQANALDNRLDIRKTLPPEITLRREPYNDFPHVQSEEPWQALLLNYPDSPLAAAARLRLAQLRLRRGNAADALKLLEPVARKSSSSSAASRPGVSRIRSDRPESSLDVDPEPYIRESQRLYELIAANRDDPRHGNEPLKNLAGLDPHRPNYRRELLKLADQYPAALLHDNLLVEWAAGTPERAEREANLAACVAAFPGGDAFPEAQFKLAELELQPRGEDQESRRQEAIGRLRLLSDNYAATVWGAMAAERLRALQPRAETYPAPGAP